MNPTRPPGSCVVLMMLALGVSGCSPTASDVTHPKAASSSSTVSPAAAPLASVLQVSSNAPTGAVFGPPAPTGASAGSAAAPMPSAHPGGGVPPGILQGNLGVRDQRGDGGSVSLSAEIDGSPGWVVVARDNQGGPRKVLGSIRRGNGVHDDVVVIALKPALTTSTRLWATLVVDVGRPGILEYPGVDRPLQFQGRDLSRAFTYTVG